MAKQHPEINDALGAFIGRQRIFFAASAAAGTRINLSPRGTEALRILGPLEVCYLDQTGSGNETAAHLLADGRLTLMFCAFEGPPQILRLYGRGEALARGTPGYAALLEAQYEGRELPGARQIVRLAVEIVQTSCGFGVPLFTFMERRTTLDRWAESKGEEGLAAYRREKNRVSMDGLPTGLPEAEGA
ncbi:MAG: pyridoxamine 5'-phosphate oxidase family protein [Alsobacter sp.]